MCLHLVFIERLGFNKRPKEPKQCQRHKPKIQKKSNHTFEDQESSDMSKCKWSEETLTEDLDFDSFFSEEKFENTFNESEMCNLNTPSEKSSWI